MLVLNEANFETEVTQSQIPVLVDFFAVWCGPCQMASPVLDELEKEYQGKVKFGKLDIDVSQALAVKFGVMSVPTVMVFAKGKEVGRQVGFVGKEGYKKLIQSLIP